MAEPLDVQVILDIADAESRVEDLRSSLEAALTGATDSFGSSMAEMLDSISSAAADTFSALSDSGSTGIAQVGTDAELAVGDLSNLGSEGAASLAQIGSGAESAGEGVTSLGNEAASALAGVGTSAETASDSVTELGGEGAGALEELSAAASDAGGAVSEVQSASAEADSSVGDLSSATAGLATGMALAKGEGRGVAEGLAGIGVLSKGAAAGILAGAGALAAFFTAGIRAQSAAQQLVIVFGDQAEAIKEINIGGLTGNLDDLAEQVGTTGAQLDNSLARLGAYGQVAEFSAGQTREFTQNVAALALRAVALNPSIGSVDQAIKALSRGLAVGGRFAQNYYLNLSRPEITDRAVRMFGVTASALTQTQRSAAGAALAVESLGGRLGKDFADNAENAQNKLNALKAAVENAFERAGTGLVDSLTSLLSAAIPVATTFADALGPALSAVAEVLDFLGPLIPPVVAGFLGFKAISLLAGGIELAATGFLNLAVVLPAVESTALGAATGMEALSASISGSSIGLIIGIAAFAATALGVFGGGTDEATQSVESFGDSLAATGNLLDEETQKALVAALAATGLQSAFAKSGTTISLLDTALTGSTKGLGDLADTVRRADNVNGQLNTTINAQIQALGAENPALAGILIRLRDHNQLTSENVDALFDLNAERGKGITVAKEAASVVDDLTAAQQAEQFQTDVTAKATSAKDAIYKQTVASYASLIASGFQEGEALHAEAEAYAVAQQAASEYRTAQEILNSTTLTLAQAESSQVSAVRETNKALKDTAGTIVSSIAVGSANFNQIVSTTQAVEGYGFALVGAGFNQSVADANLQKYTAGLIFQLLMTGRSTTAVAELVTKLGLVSSVTDPATRAILGFGATTEELPRHGKKGADDYQRAIEKGLVQGTRGAINAATKIFTDDKGLVGAADGLGRRAGRAFDTGMAAAIENNKQSVYVAAQHAVQAAIDGANNAGSPSEHLFFDAGASFINAMASGIDDGAGALSASMAGAVRNAGAQVPFIAPASVVQSLGGGALGADGAIHLAIQVNVNGVSDPNTAEVVGQQAMRGALGELDGATRRRILIESRIG